MTNAINTQTVYGNLEHQKARVIINRIEAAQGVDLKVKTRRRVILEPRQIAYYVIKQKTRLSLSEMGHLFWQDHATAIHAINTVKVLLEDKRYRNQYRHLFEMFDVRI